MNASNRNREGRKNRKAKKAVGFYSGLRFIANLFLASRPTPGGQRPAMSCSELYRFKTLRFRINGISSK
jgi:hypothetical protein